MSLRKTSIGLLLAASMTAASAPKAYADGWYVGGTVQTTPNAYWDPSCGCWVYPSYSYYPAYTTYPAYGAYTYPQYSYPYYSRPSFSVGFSFGSQRHYGGYGYRRWHR